MVGVGPRTLDVTPKEAVALQRELAARVQRRSARRLDALRVVAGLDVSYDKATRLCHAAIVVVDRTTMETLEEIGLSEPARFPYVPGLLSFREIPPLLAALERIRTPIDAFIADGQGIAHPRRIGLAAHFGLCVEKPAVGCAKSILVGEPKGRLAKRRGSRVPLVDPKTEEEIGAVVRTRDGVSPVYVSVGHRISLDDAVALVLACTTGFRLTEPIRRAHTLSNRLLRGRGR